MIRSFEVHALPPARVIQSIPPATSSRVAPADWMSTGAGKVAVDCCVDDCDAVRGTVAVDAVGAGLVDGLHPAVEPMSSVATANVAHDLGRMTFPRT